MTTARPNAPHIDATDLVTGHFREKRGYATWRDHGTGDWLLIYTAAGKGRFGYRTPGGSPAEIITTRGDLALLRPGALHDYGVEPTLQRWELLWTHFQPRPHWLDCLAWPDVAAPGTPPTGLMRLRLAGRKEHPAIVARFRDVHRYATGGHRRRNALAMAALEELLLLCDTINPAADAARLDDRVRAAMDFLCRHMTEKIPLDALADHVNLSVSRLAHLFRAQAGVTPQQFLETQRLARAMQLLELSPHAIKQIAHEVGFENPFYFTLRFKRHTGLSPRAWRHRAVSRPARQAASRDQR